MASVAYSTPARVAQPGPVTRAVIAMRGGSDPEQHRGLGCVILDEPVFFDAGQQPRTGELALVVLHGGGLAVLPVVEGYTLPEQGFVYVECASPVRGAISARSKVALVGAVRAPE